MAIKASAKKARRQSEKRKIGNLQYKKRIKESLKKVRVLSAEKKTEELKAVLPQVYKALDKAAKAGVIKKNNASRRKSRISKFVAKTGK
ncbi:MAG: 30S ribosomal protein S20 [Candidatus Paceibacterota bacterium]|jgi:small subunit ribosomal protein S20|nr:30S ribosomal protein S20 [Candidatus Paceibacterota bacterium]MDD4830608.1 30S ribosomal protein S20 [Candidatus Paceibacterota bacterium]MDD4874929.1 30S ribosomal protein S20 [Candidatus Paceibacterota bacterium]